jgi:hypothetical protein
MGRRRYNNPMMEGQSSGIPDDILNYIRNQHGQTKKAEPTAQTYSKGLGTLDYEAPFKGKVNLPSVADPEQTFADISKNQYMTQTREFGPFEDALISTLDDTSLIDAVPEDVERQGEIAKGIASRNRQRYGYQQTGVEAQESGRAFQRSQSLNLAGGKNNARIAQRERNRSLLADLINIGQDQNRSSLSMLGTAAENAVARDNAFTQAQASAKAQKWGNIGSALSSIGSFI